MGIKCCCKMDACKEEGSEAGLNLPTDRELRRKWLTMLGLGPGDRPTQFARVSIIHFRSHCVKSTRISSHSPGVVSVIKGAMPDRSEEEIIEAYRCALGGWMKSEARCWTLARQVAEQAGW